MDILNDPKVAGLVVENQMTSWYTQYQITLKDWDDFLYLLSTYAPKWEVPLNYPHDILKKPLQVGDNILYANAAKDSSLKQSVLEEDPNGSKYSVSFSTYERDERQSHTKSVIVIYQSEHDLLRFKMKNGKYKPATNRDIVKIDI